MNRTRIFVTLIIPAVMLIAACTSVQKSVITETKTAADSIALQLLNEGQYDDDKNIAVLPFIETGTRTSNEFSNYFADELIASLFRAGGGKLVILERSQVDQLLKEAEIAASGLLSEDTAVQLGMMIGVDAVVIGSYRVMEDTVRINARSVSVESGKISAVADADLSEDAYYTVLQGSSKKESASETVKEPVHTIIPGVLTVGYTDIYVDGYLNQDENGPHGMDSEIAGEIAAALGFNIEWLLIPNEGNFFESITRALNGEKIDMFISVTSILPDRSRSVLFSIPYTTEGDKIGISFRKDNGQLKSAVDPVLERLKSDGTIDRLRMEYIDPLDNIFETNNTMRTLSGTYFVQSRLSEGRDGLQDRIEIRYSKDWFSFDVRGDVLRKIKIGKVSNGVMLGTMIESSIGSSEKGASVRIEFDIQQLIDTGSAEMQLQVGNNPVETLSMIKVE